MKIIIHESWVRSEKTEIKRTSKNRSEKVDCIKRTTQRVSVIMQDDKKKPNKNADIVLPRKILLGKMIDLYLLCLDKQSVVSTFRHISSGCHTHAHTLAYRHTHTHTHATIHTCKVGCGWWTGCIRSAPSSSCSLPGLGSGEGRRPLPAARWSSQTETLPLQKTTNTSVTAGL